jgi:hypothetical protein
MTSTSWIIRTAALIAALLCINFAVAISTDPYGLFRDTHGRQLRYVFAGRKAKYLLSKHYVPQNYDALLIGPSSGENWDLSGITGYKFYNESILGSNVVEEKRIVDQAIPSGQFKLAVFILYPTMTVGHDMKDGLDAVSWVEALGSIHLYINGITELLGEMHHPVARASAPDGTTPLRESAPQQIVGQHYPPDYYKLDPIAVASYQQLVKSLQDRGAQIIYIVPPLYEACRTANAVELEDHKAAMERLLPEAPVLDMDGPEFADFRSDIGNYIDCFHVNAKGAARIDAYLTQGIPAALNR